MKAKNFFKDCATVFFILLWLLFICGIVNGEASAAALIFVAASLIFVLWGNKKPMRKKAKPAIASTYSRVNRAA